MNAVLCHFYQCQFVVSHCVRVRGILVEENLVCFCTKHCKER